MTSRIIVAFNERKLDPLGEALGKTIRRFLGIRARSLRTSRVYVINAELSKEEETLLERNLFVDPVTEHSEKDTEDGSDWLVEVSYKAGVTNPVSKTATAAANEILKNKLKDAGAVSTATNYLISGVTKAEAERISKGLLANPIIETTRILSKEEVKSGGIPMTGSAVAGADRVEVKAYDLDVSDSKLLEISRNGVLSLSLPEMKLIQKYVKSRGFSAGRKKIGMGSEFWGKLTDVELEAIAQTQSEHCKHKIFNGIIEYGDGDGKKQRIDGLFGTYIKGPSKRLANKYGWVVSAFHDNAGIVDVGNGMLVADKIETHNAPSALEPYGGAITGILGVNRDVMGAGLGAKPLFNVFAYCFGNPFYRGKLPEGVLHPARIRNGVHKGVIDGGNQSGIPLADGSELFDDSFGFRPLVYCGTIGLMPKTINGKPAARKKADIGDLIIMVGGKIGKDGIHGATFSSAELDKGSPVQAVQIGDSITQKKMSDFLLEARDMGLYKCITDDGAGGLSSSVGEMAKDTNGCKFDLKKAPLKYAGLAPWEILLSESQERMTVAVEPSKVERFMTLAKMRDVEATVLGEFNSTGKFHVLYCGKTVAYLDMRFLHEGFPRMKLEAKWKAAKHEEPNFRQPKNFNSVLQEMLARPNICSKEYKMRQYDHEVRGRSIIKPFVGKDADAPSDATVSLLDYGGKAGLIVTHGINPYYSQIDTYHMAASAIDEAIRRIIAVGGKMPSRENVLYGLDNFCWNLSALDDADGRYKLAQLVRANRALADYCTAFGVPCISGKDSMKNVWRSVENVGGKRKEKVISILPTLLFSARAKIADVSKAVTMDAKQAGDLVYVIGKTNEELGASEYFSYMGEKLRRSPYIGDKVPRVYAAEAKKTYAALSNATERRLVSSIHTPTFGGLGVALAQTAFAGGLGMEIDLAKVPYFGERRDDYVLFSQSNSRFVVTVPKARQKQFESAMGTTVWARVGEVNGSDRLRIRGLSGRVIINSSVGSLKSAWKRTLEGV